MTLIHLAQHVTPWLADLSHWSNSDSGLLWQLPHPDWNGLAQIIYDTDVFKGFRNAFNNFIQSGQVWALIIGFVFGYILRGMTYN